MSAGAIAIADFEPSRLRPGAKTQVALNLPGLGVPCRLPALAVSGAAPGPTLIATAGVHGDEYEGAVAIRRVFERLDPAALAGVFVGLPRINPPAFDSGTRRSPASLDGLDLNRCWPGRAVDAGGRPTEILADAVWRILASADLLADLHAGGADYEFGRVTGFPDVRSPARERSQRAAAEFGGDALWRMPRTDGVLIWEFANRTGRPAIAAETAGRGACDAAEADRFAAGLENLMRMLGMLAGPMPPPADIPVMDTIYQECPADGLFIPAVGVGDLVAADQSLGTILDEFGVPAAGPAAMLDGWVLALRRRARITTDDWLCCLGTRV